MLGVRRPTFLRCPLYVEIPSIQEFLGHHDPSTMVIHTHVLQQGGSG